MQTVVVLVWRVFPSLPAFGTHVFPVLGQHQKNFLILQISMQVYLISHNLSEGILISVALISSRTNEDFCIPDIM